MVLAIIQKAVQEWGRGYDLKIWTLRVFSLQLVSIRFHFRAFNSFFRFDRIPFSIKMIHSEYWLLNSCFQRIQPSVTVASEILVWCIKLTFEFYFQSHSYSEDSTGNNDFKMMVVREIRISKYMGIHWNEQNFPNNFSKRRWISTYVILLSYFSSCLLS